MWVKKYTLTGFEDLIFCSPTKFRIWNSLRLFFVQLIGFVVRPFLKRVIKNSINDGNALTLHKLIICRQFSCLKRIFLLNSTLFFTKCYLRWSIPVFFSANVLNVIQIMLQPPTKRLGSWSWKSVIERWFSVV